MESCPTGQLETIDGDGLYVCAQCTAPCHDCSGTLTNCTWCVSPYYLDTVNHLCVTTCTGNYFPFDGTSTSVSNECRSCLPGCVACSDESYDHCTSCGMNDQTPLYLHFGTTHCRETCPDNYYPGTDSNAHTCQPCATGCAKCFGGLVSECTEC